MRVATGTLVLLAGLAGSAHSLRAQCNQDCPERRTISVNGNGMVTADADLAIVRVGYKLYGPNAKEAYASATETSNAIMQALTSSGIPKTAIESTSQVLQHTPIYELQQYPTSDPERVRREFTVSQSWVIRVKPDQASAALDTAVISGANESGWIQWIVENPDILLAAASAKAAGNARMIAEEVAAKSNVHLGHLVTVNQNPAPMIMDGAIGGPVGGFGMGTAAISNLTMNNQPLALNSRRVEFRTTVYAVFSIE